MKKWHHENRSTPFAGSESIQWFMEEQYRIDGNVDVRLWVSVTTRSKISSRVWAEATVTAAQLDDPVVVVTLSEAHEACKDGRYNDARGLVELLTTM